MAPTRSAADDASHETSPTDELRPQACAGSCIRLLHDRHQPGRGDLGQEAGNKDDSGGRQAAAHADATMSSPNRIFDRIVDSLPRRPRLIDFEAGISGELAWQPSDAGQKIRCNLLTNPVDLKSRPLSGDSLPSDEEKIREKMRAIELRLESTARTHMAQWLFDRKHPHRGIQGTRAAPRSETR
jgi:hypothetical protein